MEIRIPNPFTKNGFAEMAILKLHISGNLSVRFPDDQNILLCLVKISPTHFKIRFISLNMTSIIKTQFNEIVISHLQSLFFQVLRSTRLIKPRK